MIRFECDWCQNLKAADDVWILGLAAEAVGATTARREVTILSAWNRETALAPLAVHFCSEECKGNYMATLFDQQARGFTRSSSKTRKSATRKRARTSARKKPAA
jgi:hypothetical protein